MHRSGDIKTSMMSGIDRLTRRPVFVNSLLAPRHLTNSFGKQDFQQKYKSLPGISQAYNECEEDEIHDNTQVNFGYQDYEEGDASLHTKPSSRSNNGSSNGFPVKHVYQSPNRSVVENAKLGYDTGINDIGFGGISRPRYQGRNIVNKQVANVMKNIIANTACVDRTFISGTVRDLSLYGKHSVIPSISKRSQNQEENKGVTLNRSQPSCTVPQNQSMSFGVNSETNATHSLYGKQPVIPGITRNTQNQDLNCGMIKRVQSSYALPRVPDMLLEMNTYTTETPTEMKAIEILETHPDTKLEMHFNGEETNTESAGKHGLVIERSNACQSLEEANGASTSPCPEPLKSLKYDQGHINITEERLAKMLNENDNDKCYNEHVSDVSNNTTSCKRKELMPEEDSCNVAHSYETSQSEKSKSIESDTNMETEINNVIVPVVGTLNHKSDTTGNGRSEITEAVEKNVPNVNKEISNTEAANKLYNYEENQSSNEIASFEKEIIFKNEYTSDAEASLNKESNNIESKIVIENKGHKEENVNESIPTVEEISTSFHETEQKVALVDSSDNNTTQEKSSPKEASIIRARVIVANPESVKRKHRKRKADRKKQQNCYSGNTYEFKEESTQSTSANMKQKNSSVKTSSTKESSDTDDDIDKVPDDILDDDNNSKLDTSIQNKYRGNGSSKTVIHKEKKTRLNQKKIHKELDYKSRCDTRDTIDKSTQTITKSFEKRIEHAPINGNDVNGPNDICLNCNEHRNAVKNGLDFKQRHFLQSNLIDVSSLPAAFQPLKVWENEQTIKSKYMYKRENHNNDNRSDYNFNVPLNGKFNAATSKPIRSDLYMRIMNILDTKIGPKKALDLMRSETVTEMLKNLDKDPMKYGFSYAHVVNFRDENIYMDINKLIIDPTIEHDSSVTMPRIKQEQLRMSLSNDNKPTLTIPESDRGCKDFCYSKYVSVKQERNTRDIRDNNLCDTSCEVKADSDGGICCMNEDNTSECEIMKHCSSIKCKDNDQIPKTKQKKSDKIKSFLRSLICICKPKIDNDEEDTGTL